MSKNTKRKGNLKYSILLLLLLAILLITSTYAWFTANQTVKVSSLDVNVEAKNGLQISADAQNWKTILQKQDILDAVFTSNTNQIPDVLEPVSSAGDVSAGVMSMFYGTVASSETGDQTLTAKPETDTKGTEGRYITFDMFLKVDTETEVELTTNSNVTYTGMQDKGLQNAARVAFINEGTKGSTEISAIQEALEGDSSMIWEPNYDVHTQEAVTYAKQTYNIDTQTTDAPQIDYSGVSAQIDEGIKLSEANATDNGSYFKDVTPAISTKKSPEGNSTFMTLQAGITKVKVYMWVEGQDVDCENSASGSDISFTFELTIKE